MTQAQRQPGSAFKPFIYSAALEKGFTPATVVNDAPFFVPADKAGGEDWEPKNYDGKFEGPMRLRIALAKSKNLVTVRVLQAIGPQYAQDYIAKFGFDPRLHPAYLTMGLGAGAATPVQMGGAYAIFANGGYRVAPYLIAKITDAKGNVLSQADPPRAGANAERAIDPRNAFVMTTMLRDVVTYGTADARAGARPQGPRRQDRDDQREHRRVVLRLHARAWSASRGSASTSRARSAATRPARSPRCRSGSRSCSARSRALPEQALETPPGVVQVRINDATGLRDDSEHRRATGSTPSRCRAARDDSFAPANGAAQPRRTCATSCSDADGAQCADRTAVFEARRAERRQGFGPDGAERASLAQAAARLIAEHGARGLVVREEQGRARARAARARRAPGRRRGRGRARRVPRALRRRRASRR